MRKYFLTTFKIVLGFIFIFSHITSITAQESSEFTLEEITVTAQKREENQQKVPIAMEIISGDVLTEMSKNDLSEILSSIPGTIVTKNSDGMRVSIRGMSNDMSEKEGRHFTSVTVAVNKDGVTSNITNMERELFDVERVEVLYGPQSTLYASTAPGGIVNIVTSNPKIGVFEGAGTIEYGNFNLLHTEGVVNASVNDKMALRAGFTSTVRDGYLSNGADDEDSKSARLKALYEPNDKLSITITGELSRMDGKGFAGVDAFVDQDDVDNPWESDAETRSPRYEDIKKISGNIKWDLGVGVATIIPSYSKSDSASSSTSSDNSESSEETGSTYEKGLEARIASSEDYAIKWITGFNWYKTADRMKPTTYDADGNISSWDLMRASQEIKAVYANITYPLNDRFSVTGGLRYNWDVSTSKMDSYPATREPERTRLEYSDPDYKLGVEYDINESSMLFADWSTSYRARAMFDSDGNAFPAEEIVAYQIGSKNRFFENKLQINVSAFYYDYDNYLTALGPVDTIYDENGNGIRDFIDVDNDGVYDEGEDTYTENTTDQDDKGKQLGQAKVYGLDLQTSTIITKNDKLDVSVSLLKRYFTHLYFDWEEITNSLGVEDFDYSDKDMPFSPRYSFNLAYSHNFNLPDGGMITASFDTRYQSAYRINFLEHIIGITTNGTEATSITDIDLTELLEQEAHHISNLSAVYLHPSGKWTLTGYVKNIEDYAVKLSVEVRGSVANYRVGSPRTYGAVLSVKF